MKKTRSGIFGGKSRKMSGKSDNKALQGTAAATLIGGAGLAGFYAWQAAMRKKGGFMKFGKRSGSSRFNPFSR